MKSAYELSKPLHQDRPSSYNFGISNQSVAAGLRDLADRLDRNEVVTESAILYSRAEKENFTSSTIVLKFSEQTYADQRGTKITEQKKLYGESQFPVAVAPDLDDDVSLLFCSLGTARRELPMYLHHVVEWAEDQRSKMNFNITKKEGLSCLKRNPN